MSRIMMIVLLIFFLLLSQSSQLCVLLTVSIPVKSFLKGYNKDIHEI